MWTATLNILPSAKAVGRRLLDDASEIVELKIDKLHGPRVSVYEIASIIQIIFTLMPKVLTAGNLSQRVPIVYVSTLTTRYAHL